MTKRIAISVAAAMVVTLFPGSAASAADYSVLYSFQDNGVDGTRPWANVLNVKGTLYGTTAYGGTGTCTNEPPYGCGTVFKVDPVTAKEKVVYSFQNNGEDGEDPNASLIKVGTSLDGTTALGGMNGAGTVFSIKPKAGAETVLYSFQGGYKDAGGPEAALVDMNGTLYGTTSGGGSYQAGTVFSIDLSDGSESVVYSFCKRRYCFDGKYPSAALISVNGILYGTTEAGGSVNHGTVFSIDPSNRSESVLYSFCQEENCVDGDYPTDSLININGKLFGTTVAGGAFNQGTIFSLDLSSGKERVLYSFQGGQDGAQPIAGLLKVGGTFYGTTGNGGSSGCYGTGCGTVFSFDRKTGVETVLHVFQEDGADGEGPAAGLIDVNGTLYGTTAYGGTYGYGTVYSLVP